MVAEAKAIDAEKTESVEVPKEEKFYFSALGKAVDGYTNVGKFDNAEVKHDFSKFPWPMKDSSVQELALNHVVERLVETEDFYKFWQEVYRVCKKDAKVTLIAFHPCHDRFVADPECVRPVLPRTIAMLSKANNKRWKEQDFVATSLAEKLSVDFEISSARFGLDPIWIKKLQSNEITQKDVPYAIRTYNNVAQEIYLDLKVIK